MLKFTACLLGIVLAVCADADAQTVTSVQNPASNTLAGFPNYGIAQGSIFIVYGTGLGPATLVQGAAPYSTSLAGTSIQMSTGDLFKVYSPYIVYTSATQVAAIMPSNLPAVAASMEVFYNGKRSAVFSTMVVPNNFGISTMNQTGSGPAVITYPTSTAPFYGLLNNANAAMPGNTYTMWGTGLGAAVGGNSDSDVSVFGNVGPAIQVFVGGLQAALTYYGRSPGGLPGLDQINFTIPAGLTGCNVSLVVQNGLLVSNMTTIPIAAGGGACSDATDSSVPLDPLKLSVVIGTVSLEQFSAKLVSSSPFGFGAVVSNATNYFPGATFRNYPVSQSRTAIASSGSCTEAISTIPLSVAGTGLDAGRITVTAAGSGLVLSEVLNEPSTGNYTGQWSGFTAGSYLFTGAGGSGVGAFSAAVSAPAAFTWTNQAAIFSETGTPVVRSQGQTVTWTGGAPNSYVVISGRSPVAYGSSFLISFSCTASTSAGQFTIPASVLLAMPVSTSPPGPAFITDGTLAVQNTTLPAPFFAPGVDVGSVTATNIFNESVKYQ